MKVGKCSEDAHKNPSDTLSWSEICKTEGVYAAEGYGGVRIIVLGNSESYCHLYYYNERLECASSTWTSCRYKKLNEKICFEVRPE